MSVVRFQCEPCGQDTKMQIRENTEDLKWNCKGCGRYYKHETREGKMFMVTDPTDSPGETSYTQESKQAKYAA